jgi:hypothetical protein
MIMDVLLDWVIYLLIIITSPLCCPMTSIHLNELSEEPASSSFT